MSVIEVRGPVAAPAGVAWELLIDTQAWPRWGPSVRAVDSRTRFIGPGATGRVQTAAGLWLPFRVDDWRAGECWHWRVAGIPATGHSVSAVDDDACEVVFSIPGWAPFYRPVCALAIRRLAALAHARASGGSAG